MTPLRARAEEVLAELRADPAPFAERAAALSNCPSGQQGGNLGQFGRGEMVAGVRRARSSTARPPACCRAWWRRGYGFHIVDVVRRLPGRRLPFEAVASERGVVPRARGSRRDALRQYVAVLAGRATIEGVTLDAAATPLVQ